MYSSPWSRPTSLTEQSRVLLSRFALPEDTTFWLIVADGSLPISADDLALFDESLTLRDAEGESAESRSVDSSRFRAVLPVLREFHTERFATAWAPKRTLEPIKKPGFPTSRMHQRRYGLSADWLNLLADGSLSAEINGEHSRARLVSRVKSLSTAATSVDYGIGWGVEGLIETAMVLRSGDGHLPLHTAEFSQYRLPPSSTSHDFLKPFRTAAFAGAAVKYPTVG